MRDFVLPEMQKINFYVIKYYNRSPNVVRVHRLFSPIYYRNKFMASELLWQSIRPYSIALLMYVEECQEDGQFH